MRAPTSGFMTPAEARITTRASLEKILKLREWQPTQALLLTQYHRALNEAHVRRQELREIMAQEIVAQEITGGRDGFKSAMTRG